MNFISRLAEFGPMKRILKPLLGAGITPKLQQEQVDFYRAAVLLKGHAWHKSRDATVATTTAVPTQEDVDRFYREVDAMSSKDIKASVSKALEAQVTEMLRHVDTYSSSIEKAIAGAGSSSLASRGGDVGATAKATLLHAMGYDVEVRPSSVAGAGDGIFLRGRACPGTVVCFHPGLVHLAEYVSNADYLKTLLPDDDFMMIVRNDGHIVDARGATKVPFNPYALGHKANHVPAGQRPNLLQLAFDFPEDPLEFDAFPHELRRYIPNAYNKPPTLFGTSDRSACMRSVVYLAASPLEDGDELFVDYRLNPFAGPLPSWYTPFDSAGAMRRWHDESGTTGTTTTTSDAGHTPHPRPAGDEDELLVRKK